ncbi:hypothetical protein mvi_768 [Megavirus vitis]|uniref:DUF5866 domain-containing protein n=3 Tax=Megamimivirinae TaxID=3044648 RepID=A0A2L2DNB5_MIMIV|nr:hypothetical protein MegaChil _gp0817 [Megavirus chiliensis]AEQ33051.1 DUF5866 domain-containing protein [Megavirus chiliensis]AGD92770.1 hypothetical protein LBA_00852 [Megavirus lba]AVG47653.1 hypothetical protein [Acanthamoeba polyphaga mimivirus]AVL94128.1 hypothetical protein mvi_768 [Megavirus vitis]
MAYKFCIKSTDQYILRYSREQLFENPNVIGTLFHRVFFSGGFSKKSEITLQFEGSVLKYLIPLIREGILYLPEITSKFQTGSWIQNIIDINEEYIWSELSKMLQFIACDNDCYHKLWKIMQHGAMDQFGRKIHFNTIKKITTGDLVYLLPYDKLSSNDLRKNFMNKLSVSIMNIPLPSSVKKGFPKLPTLLIENIEKSMYNSSTNYLESIKVTIQMTPTIKRLIIYTTRNGDTWNTRDEYVDFIVNRFVIMITKAVSHYQ